MDARKFFTGRAIGLLVVLILAGIVWSFFAFNDYSSQQKQGDGSVTEPHRATLSGEFVCLPYTDSSGPQPDECTLGLLVDDGSYYVINFNLMSQGVPELAQGDRITASGLVTPIEYLSTDKWRKYPVEGIFSVTDSLTTPPGSTGPDPKNTTYIIENERVRLKSGVAEVGVSQVSFGKIIVRYFGNETRGDFNEDGVEDVALLLVKDTGGSGTFYYLVVALGVRNGYIGTNAILLGDRIVPQTTEFRNGRIIVNFADRGSGEPMTAEPSIGVSKYFEVDGRVLTEIDTSPSPEEPKEIPAGLPACNSAPFELHYTIAAEYLTQTYPNYTAVGESAEETGPCNNMNTASTLFDVLDGGGNYVGYVKVNGDTRQAAFTAQ